MHKTILSVVMLALSFLSHATTWAPSEVSDPIFPEQTCNVSEPMSYGGYIYQWPSKFDQVFWPYTTEPGIWFCEQSGFVAFINDFEGLSDAEVQRIRDYLQANPVFEPDILAKLNHLVEIYALRDTDPQFDNKLLRILARWHQSLGDLEQANLYRQMALFDIETSLKGELDDYKRLEYLFLATTYNRQLNNPQTSEQFLTQLLLAIKQNSNDDVQGYADYLRELAELSRLINAGGQLEPDVEQQNDH